MKDVIKRHSNYPVIAAKDIPYDASLIFNAGVAKYEGKYVMVFRNDHGFSPEGGGKHYTDIGIALSDDGINWEPESERWFQMQDDDIRRAYDPRITVIDGQCYLCFAVDTNHGVRGGILKTDDFDSYEVLSISAPDNRNMVLFPERINGKFARLERPFPVYGRGGGETFDTWFADSPDLKYWGNNQLVLGTEDIPFCNSKNGTGAPPVKTEKGWLTTFHAVYKDPDKPLKAWGGQNWRKEYFAGIMLPDLNEPWKVIGMSKDPLLASEEDYELDGFRGSVIFPGGMILEDSGEVKIYYGAADTVECLATAHVDDLLKLCGV